MQRLDHGRPHLAVAPGAARRGERVLDGAQRSISSGSRSRMPRERWAGGGLGHRSVPMSKRPRPIRAGTCRHSIGRPNLPTNGDSRQRWPIRTIAALPASDRQCPERLPLAQPAIRRRLPSRSRRLAVAAALLAAGLAMSCAGSIDERDAVHILTADAEVNPVMARYIDRGIDEAERTDATAVVIKLDTPGGLVSSMEDIVQRIQASKVPVIVYVSPAGGKAASAGTFITMSAHVAAMAPGTRIGAAHPVGAGGGDIEGDTRRQGRERRRRLRPRRSPRSAAATPTGRRTPCATASRHRRPRPSSQGHRRLRRATTSTTCCARPRAARSKLDGQEVTLAGLAEAERVANDMTFSSGCCSCSATRTSRSCCSASAASAC